MAGVSAVPNSIEQAPSELLVDRMSNLPSDILNIIYKKISVIDAIRMSVLAKNWRYKWLSLSNFALDCASISCVPNIGYLRYDIGAAIVSKYLLHHTEPISTFSLRTHFSSRYPDLYQWLRYLSRLKIEGLSLEEMGTQELQLPTYLFSFERLRRLFLKNWGLRIPPTFRGYNSLRDLTLSEITINDVDLDFLINVCPMLETLILWSIVGVRQLRIRAPRLTHLVVDTDLEDISIGDSPFLVEVCIKEGFGEEANINWRNVNRCLSGLGSLQILGLPGNFIKLLADANALEESPLRNRTLSSVSLNRVRFENVAVFRVCLSLLTSCPNIEEFCFSVETARGPRIITQFLRENQGQFSFGALKTISMTGLPRIGFGSTVNFIEFICIHSPNLKRITIRRIGAFEVNQTRDAQIVARLRRFCPRALVQYMHQGRFINI